MSRESDVERICHEALALATGAREAFVANACSGDEALRREVESLLRQESKADGFLVEPALVAAAQHVAANSGQSIRSLRPAVSQRQRGAMEDLDVRRHMASLGAQRQGALLCDAGRRAHGCSC